MYIIRFGRGGQARDLLLAGRACHVLVGSVLILFHISNPVSFLGIEELPRNTELSQLGAMFWDIHGDRHEQATGAGTTAVSVPDPHLEGSPAMWGERLVSL